MQPPQPSLTSGQLIGGGDQNQIREQVLEIVDEAMSGYVREGILFGPADQEVLVSTSSFDFVNAYH